MSTISDSPSPIKKAVINTLNVVEVRATWARMAASPWAGFGLRHTVRTTDGAEAAVMGYEAAALLDALKAAGVALVERVEGWSRIVRVTSAERRVTSEEKSVPRPGSVAEAIEQMVALGKGNRPALGKRLESAGVLVRDGLVALVDEGEARIGPYVISAEACTCGDFRHRRGWCKHRLAVRMGRHLARHGFALPVARTETTPLISDENRALIESGRVMDEAFRRSSYGAERRALASAANGRSIAAADWQRLHGGKQ